MMKFQFLVSFLSFYLVVAYGQQAGLKVQVLTKVPSENVVVSCEGYNQGGNTSVAFDGDDTYKWSGKSDFKTDSWGYFVSDTNEVPYIKRDRDLGQTFTYLNDAPRQLEAITVSTGYGTHVIRPNMYGQRISLQLFEVKGNPVILNNGSDSTMEAFHGFPHNRLGTHISHERDDFISGEKFKSIAVFSGATFPLKEAFGFENDALISPNHPNLKGKLLRFVLPKESKIILKPGGHYAFLIIINKMCAGCGFTLANSYIGKYPGGHGIRRDGNGKFPPVVADPLKHFKDPVNAKAYASAHFPTNFKKRIKISPSTNGYPDVDTWRDLQFYIQAK